MSMQQNDAFTKLLRAWNHHHGLKMHGAELTTMVEARRELDAARLEMARVRAR